MESTPISEQSVEKYNAPMKKHEALKPDLANASLSESAEALVIII